MLGSPTLAKIVHYADVPVRRGAIPLRSKRLWDKEIQLSRLEHPVWTCGTDGMSSSTRRPSRRISFRLCYAPVQLVVKAPGGHLSSKGKVNQALGA
jgi:hypothetical protein